MFDYGERGFQIVCDTVRRALHNVAEKDGQKSGRVLTEKILDALVKMHATLRFSLIPLISRC